MTEGVAPQPASQEAPVSEPSTQVQVVPLQSFVESVVRDLQSVSTALDSERQPGDLRVGSYSVEIPFAVTGVEPESGQAYVAVNATHVAQMNRDVVSKVKIELGRPASGRPASG